MAFTQLGILTSCAQNDESNFIEKTKTEATPVKKTVEKPTNEYGGWYCPDNLGGFPAVDLAELHTIPVVVGRLPTREETRNGTSLLYFDSEKYPEAKPVDITLPKVARYYNKNTQKNEVIVVIQAVEVDNDTVVGFRYLNGGNGSAWYSEIAFLSDTEVQQMGATPFVAINTDLKTTPEKIWEVITNPKYAKELGAALNENTMMESDWKENPMVYIKNKAGDIIAKGHITIAWENTYFQIDYDLDGVQYVEKFFMSQNQDTQSTQFRVVAGPFATDFESKKMDWNNWYAKVKELSEKL